MSLVVAACFSSSLYADVLPVNPNVVAGSATFSQTGNVLNITNSNGAVINWQQFNIGAGNTVNFLQSSASSSVLNRVIGPDPSQILGNMGSNGRVLLINTNGIFIGQGAKIDVAGFLASTLNISDANFIAGKYLFDATPGAGSVVNQGSITTTTGGTVYLVASEVRNEGVITTPGGEVLLAAGQSVQLIDTATPGVKIEVTGSTGTVTNLGTILANAGRIGMAGVLVRNSGTLNASSVVNEGGRIFLKASQDAYVDGNGRIVTTGTKGGQVEVLGKSVVVTDNATIDASGSAGGGSVLLGGDAHGSNAQIINADTAYFGKDAIIRADATDSGNGGKVVVWSNTATNAYGQIFARGGVNGGDGGFVETSGHTLDVNGIRVNTLAPKGKTGSWLLDPGSICVYNSNSTLCTGADSSVSWSSIDSNLATSEVALETDGNSTDQITIAEGYTYTRENRLHFYSRGDILVQDVFVQNSGSVAIDLIAGWNGQIGPSAASVPGTGRIDIHGSTIKTNGSMSWDAGLEILVRGSTNNASLVQAYGQTFKSTSGTITVYGGIWNNNRSATIESLGGTQKLSANQIKVLSNLAVDPYSAYSGNSASILANGTQEIEITGSGGQLLLNAGYSAMVAGNNNYAVIRQNATGGTQRVTVYGGGSISLYGGSNGYGNWAKLDGHMGSQYIGSSTDRTTISLYGGNGGGSYSNGNDASIGLSDLSAGTLTVYGTSLNIYGGNSTYGGAGLGGATQRIDLSGSLYMEGGSTYNVDEDNVPSSIAYIGSKYGADISIKATGGVTLKGGTGSPVLVGSLYGTANVSIESGAGWATYIYSNSAGNRGGVFIGSASEFGTLGTTASSNPLFSNDVMLGENTSIKSGADLYIRSYGGSVGLGYVESQLNGGYGAVITAYGAILDQNGSSVNVKADTISLTSEHGGSSGGLAISADTIATNSLTANVNSGAVYGGISVRNWGSQPLTSVSLTDASLYDGDISFYNEDDLSLSSGLVTTTTSSGDILIATGGNLTSNGFSGTVSSGGSMILAAGEKITVLGNTSAQNSSSVKQDLAMVSGGDMDIQTGTVTGDDITLVAGGTLTVFSDAAVNASASLAVVAGNVTIQGGSYGWLKSGGDTSIITNNLTMTDGASINAGNYSNPNADVSIAVSGDIRLNNGANIIAANDVYLDMLGSASTLYLNDSTGKSASYIWADTVGLPQTIHIDFLTRTAGGIVIDGSESTTTLANGSGFFNGYVGLTRSPAVAGSGLKLAYAVPTNAATQVITQVLQDSTNKNKLSEQSSSTTTVVLKPVGSTTSSSSQTIGGDSDDSFGGGDKKDDKSSSTGSDETKGKSNGKTAAKNQCS
jgi:filamentous hemagglutinin family protein